jgi:hypothetical protein
MLFSGISVDVSCAVFSFLQFTAVTPRLAVHLFYFDVGCIILLEDCY